MLLQRGKSEDGRFSHPQHSIQIVPTEDAYLMAAAPDLLAALRDYMANSGPDWQAKSCGHQFQCICSHDAALRAIAKAEGR